MHIQIQKQDHQLQCSDAVGECDPRPHDVVVIDSDDDDFVDDFEICAKPCAAADFASEDEYSQHMLRHVRPFSIRVPKVDLSRFQPIPDRVNAFRVPKKPGPACSKISRHVLVGGFRVELTNLSCLSQDFVYEVMQRIVDPALLEPIVLLYVLDASGRFHIVSGVERMTISSVNNVVYSHPSHDYIAATPYPVAAVSAAPSYQKPEQRLQMDMMEELALRYGVPLDYLVDVTRSFGSSHFMLNSPMSQFPLLPMPPKPRNRSSGMSRQAAPAKKPPSDVVVLRNADGSMAISGEINLAQTSRIVTGPLSTVTTVAPSSIASGGAFTSNAGSRFPLTSVSSSCSTGGRSLLTKAVVTSSTCKVTSTMGALSGPMSHVQIINGGSFIGGPTSPKTFSQDRLRAQLLASKLTTTFSAAPHKLTKADENGAGNPLVMKRVPLSVRQPPYPKMVLAERKAAKSQSGPLDSVFVSAEQRPLSSPGDVAALCNEVIDLLSDDENDVVEKEVSENDIGQKKVDENEICQKKVDENCIIGPKEVDENDVGPKKVDENLNGLKKVDDQNDGGQKKVDDITDGGQGKVDDEFQIPDEIEEIIVLE